MIVGCFIRDKQQGPVNTEQSSTILFLSYFNPEINLDQILICF